MTSAIVEADRRRTTRARAQIRKNKNLTSVTSEALADPTKALKSLDDEYVQCRDLRHPWEVVGYYRADGGVRRRLKCPRCGTQRIDEWTKSGHRMGTRYEYAPGYQLKGTGGASNEQIRVEVLRRVRVFANENALLQELGVEGGAA